MWTEHGCRPGSAWVGRGCVLAAWLFGGGLLAGSLGCQSGDLTGDDREGSDTALTAGRGGGQAGGAAGSTEGDFGNTTSSPPVSTLQDSGIDGDAGCGATSLEAEQIVIETEVLHEMVVETPKPVALYLMLDQSSSMQLGGLWDPAKLAIKTFVDDMTSAGLDVALEVFPPLLGEVGECTGAGYDAPTVAMGVLPGNAMLIKDALDGMPIATGIGTPIEGALRGATGFCLAYETAHPDEECVAVLITDGAPLGCAEDESSLTTVVADAFADDVPTFAVGLTGADFALLDQIAMLGGAVDCDDASATFACDVSAGPAKLLDALAKIREVVQTVETTTEIVTTIEETPLECEWAIPKPPNQMIFDRDKVNVQLSSPSLAQPIALGNVAGEDGCKEKGWYYDDPVAPTRVIACEQSCELLQSTPQAKIDILLGCKTIPLM